MLTTIWTWGQQGGPIMWIILAVGILATGVYIERALHLHRARIRSDDFLKGICNIVGRGNIDEAVTICEETPGPVAYVVKTAILHRHDPRELLREALRDASRAEISRMERRLVVVATAAQVSPLLGLLGTILGMLGALVRMEQAVPLLHAGDLLGGMRQALITTAAGLCVALPCFAFFNALVVSIDRIAVDMERASSEMVAFLCSLRPGNERSAGDVGATPGA